VGWTIEGRPIRRARFASSQAEAKAMLLEMIAARDTARPLPDDRLTVGKWLVTWLKRQEARGLRPNTIEAYERSVRLILPELGSVPLRRLRSSQVEAALASLGHKPYTVAGVRSVLSTAIKDAMREGHVSTNEAALARGPKMPRKGKPAPDVATVRAILTELSGHRLHALFVLLAGTGLRIGEATGLRWEDVDGLGLGPMVDRDGPAVSGRRGGQADGGGVAPVRGPDAGVQRGSSVGGGLERVSQASLTVRYQLQRIQGEHVLTDPKTDTAGRVVFLPPTLQAALRSHKARQAEERIAAGPKWRATDLVFTNPEGQPVAESTAQWVLSRAAKAAGVRHVSPHDLRRSYLSVVQDAVGMDAAQLVAGHTSPKQTAVYVTVRDRLLTAAAEAAEEALG
jgi:integrase